MTNSDRRDKIIDIISRSEVPVSGAELASMLGVSRQVIVQDIALIRAGENDIISTNRGYIIHKKNAHTRVFKVRHKDEESEKELNEIVDMGGIVRDVFVYHKVYGVIKAEMNIKNRKDVREYLAHLSGGSSYPLMKITDDYHYHTVEAESEDDLDAIQEKLWEMGFLAKLREHEPVEFASTRRDTTPEGRN